MESAWENDWKSEVLGLDLSGYSQRFEFQSLMRRSFGQARAFHIHVTGRTLAQLVGVVPSRPLSNSVSADHLSG